MEKLKIIISGGGTGGHIFPAIAIARSIAKQRNDVDFLFVGAKNRMEMSKVPESGYKIKGLWISGFQRKLSLKNLLFPFKLFYSLLQAYFILIRYKPDLVIGTGGYASGPLLFQASIRGVPSLIQEQNSYPGITNRILARYVDKICVAYDNMQRFFPKNKILKTGNPIREDILNFNNKITEGKSKFTINCGHPTVLVVGGSLGAKSINETIFNNLTTFKSMNLNLIWQTGVDFFDKAENKVKQLNISQIKVCKFIKEMDLAYASSDIIISRAGAIAISELCCIAKAVILVPSPNVSENHQYKNAQSLVNKNAALLVKDCDTSRKLVDTLIDLLENKKLQMDLGDQINDLAIKNASTRIAEVALGLIKK